MVMGYRRATEQERGSGYAPSRVVQVNTETHMNCENLNLRRAQKGYVMAALAYGHSRKGEAKRDASKARRRLDKAVVKADADRE